MSALSDLSDVVGEPLGLMRDYRRSRVTATVGNLFALVTKSKDDASVINGRKEILEVGNPVELATKWNMDWPPGGQQTIFGFPVYH